MLLVRYNSATQQALKESTVAQFLDPGPEGGHLRITQTLHRSSPRTDAEARSPATHQEASHFGQRCIDTEDITAASDAVRLTDTHQDRPIANPGRIKYRQADTRETIRHTRSVSLSKPFLLFFYASAIF